VPASSANLGPGFDAFAAALALHVELEVLETGRFGVETRLDIARDRRNLCVRGFARLHPPDDFTFRIRSQVPLSGGLGSSAAAYVAGLSAAANLFELDEDLLAHATELEGHPDNAAAALLGGFTVAARVDDGVEALRFDAPRDLRAVLFIPELRLSTADMRGVLPDQVPLEDAVSNLTRVAVGVAGMATGRFDLLRVLTVDKLHEPYRAKAFPQLPRFIADARTAGAIGACLSGAGSTIIAFTDTMSGVTRLESAFRAASADTDLAGRIEVVAPRNTGAKIV
jgi:homoserine kinase